MLFHMTATHTADNCPGYNPELMPGLVEAIEGSDAVASDLGIKVHFMVNAAPEHVTYALVETDDSSRLALWTTSFPFKQDFKITPVRREAELTEMGMITRRRQRGNKI